MAKESWLDKDKVGRLTLKELMSFRRVKRGGKTPPTNYLGIQGVIPVPIGKLLACYAEFVPRSKGPNLPPKYRTIIVFHYIDFQDEQDNKHPFAAIVAPRQPVQYFSKPSESKTRVLVTCTCPDFYWTWWWYVDKYEGLAGKKFPHPSKIGYGAKRVRDKKKYGHVPGSRNDERAPGICKHIVVMVRDLKSDKNPLKARVLKA